MSAGHARSATHLCQAPAFRFVLVQPCLAHLPRQNGLESRQHREVHSACSREQVTSLTQQLAQSRLWQNDATVSDFTTVRLQELVLILLHKMPDEMRCESTSVTNLRHINVSLRRQRLDRHTVDGPTFMSGLGSARLSAVSISRIRAASYALPSRVSSSTAAMIVDMQSATSRPLCQAHRPEP
jgi:hypothetical protein